MKKFFAMALAVALCAGCTPAEIRSQAIPGSAENVKVLVHRDHAYQFSLLDIVFGSNQADLAMLHDRGNIQLEVPEGKQDFFVRTTQGDRPFVLSLDVHRGDKVCLLATANTSNYAKWLLLNLSTYFTSSFSLQQVSCDQDVFKASA